MASDYAPAGQQKEARVVLDQLMQLSVHSYVSPYHLALLHLHMGERERALELLVNAPAIKDAWIVWLGVEPQWDPLRGEPAFEAILRDLRHPALQRKSAKRASAAAVAKRKRNAERIAPITTQILIPTPETQAGENEEAR